jgi:hypothetical protein
MQTRALRLLAGLASFAFVAASGCSASDPAPEDTGEAADAVTSTPTVKAPKPTETTFGRATKDRLTQVPIATKRFAQPKVLLSVKLDDVTTAETLLLRGELTLSTCGGKDISGDASDGEKNPCSIPELKRSPYGYSPHFGAYIALGSSAGDTNGAKLSAVHDVSCSGREHHCTNAIPQVNAKTQNPRNAYVNLVVGADDPAARGFDLMIVEQDHAVLTVTRLGAKAAPPILRKATSDSLEKGKIDIDREDGDGGPLGVDPKIHHPIYQVKLDGLKPGDIVDADASLVAHVHGGPADCDAYMSQEIVITRDSNPNGQKRPGDEWLTQVNGKNCTDHGGSCGYRKSGAVELGRDAPASMFVTLVATAGRTCVPPGYTWETGNGGSLDVTVRR